MYSSVLVKLIPKFYNKLDERSRSIADAIINKDDEVLLRKTYDQQLSIFHEIKALKTKYVKTNQLLDEKEKENSKKKLSEIITIGNTIPNKIVNPSLYSGIMCNMGNATEMLYIIGGEKEDHYIQDAIKFFFSGSFDSK